MFACGNALNLMQYKMGVPGSVAKVIAQLKVPISAWVSKLILSKKHTFNQWIAIYLQLLSVSVFLIIRQGGDKPTSASEIMIFMGMVFGVVNTLFAVTGAVMNEKVFKKAKQRPFIVQKFHVEVSQLCVCVLFLYLFPYLGWGIDRFLAKPEMEKMQDMYSWRARFQCIADVQQQVLPLVGSGPEKGAYQKLQDLGDLKEQITKSRETAAMSYEERKQLDLVKSITAVGDAAGK